MRPDIARADFLQKSNKGFAEEVCVQQVQAINPRAARFVEDAPLVRETFKDAKGSWLHVVTVGLLLLGGAFALAMAGVRHDADDALLRKFKMGFVAGPGGPKVWILDDLLRTPVTKMWALASLSLYVAGVLAVMWPERIGVMGIAGIGRLIACLMAVAALVFGIGVARGSPDMGRVLKVGYDELLTWLIFLDMAVMILVNMRIAGIAGRGGYHMVAKVTGAMMAVQVIGILMLMFALNVSHASMGIMWASAGAYAVGGIGVGLVSAFLVLRIGWEVIARRARAMRQHDPM